MTNQELLEILRADVKPAMGCTGPISVVFAAAAAARAIGGRAQKLRLLVDKDTYKNSISVVTPGTPYMGVREPAVVGAFYGNPAYGLEALKDLGDTWDKESVNTFAKEHTTVNIRWEQVYMGVYVEAEVESNQGIGRAIVARTHDGLVLLQSNGKTLYQDESYTDSAFFEEEKPIRAYRIADLFAFADSVDVEKLAFLQVALDANYALAQAGLEHKYGAGFGAGLSALGNDVIMRAKALAAAASDARMAGVPMSAMSCGGSGNVGITASVPLMEIARDQGCDSERLLRAVALSYLLTIMGKAHIGRLSPICACAIVASMGIAGGSCYLMGGNAAQVEHAVDNLIGSIGGVLCDGAKYGCALKLAAGVGVGLESAMLALRDVFIPAGNGVVGKTADDTLALLGTLASPGMLREDELLCRAMMEREA